MVLTEVIFMAYSPLQRQDLPQVLTDSAFTRQEKQLILAYYDEGKLAEVLPLLRKQRGALLDTIHERQSNLECLDYLIYQLKKAQTA